MFYAFAVQQNYVLSTLDSTVLFLGNAFSKHKTSHFNRAAISILS